MTRHAFAGLARLSFARVDGHRRVPSVPTNTERLQAFRLYQPVQFANATLASRISAAAYAAAAAAAAASPDYDTDLRDGFALKYGETQ